MDGAVSQGWKGDSRQLWQALDNSGNGSLVANGLHQTICRKSKTLNSTVQVLKCHQITIIEPHALEWKEFLEAHAAEHCLYIIHGALGCMEHSIQNPIDKQHQMWGSASLEELDPSCARKLAKFKEFGERRFGHRPLTRCRWRRPQKHGKNLKTTMISYEQ